MTEHEIKYILWVLTVQYQPVMAQGLYIILKSQWSQEAHSHIKCKPLSIYNFSIKIS